MTANCNAGSWIGRHVETGRPIEVKVADGIVQAIVEAPESPELPWLSAGWIDLQVNGCNGGDFNGDRTDAEDLVTATRYLWSKGVTRYLPTVITGSFERMDRAMRTIALACEREPDIGASIGGIHMEGPYISDITGPRGAHSVVHVRKPDIREFDVMQKSAGGRIALVTLAPELEGAEAFIRHAHRSGVIVSIGHSSANADQIAAAATAGATMSTHLGNGSHLTLPRHPNYIWDQLADDRLYAGLIADGHHLPTATLKTMLRAKGDKAFLVSDCVDLAGLPPGVYGSEIGGQVVLREDGRLYMQDNPGILAGSASTLETGIRILVGTLGYSLADAVALVTERPAEAMGWSGLGRLEPGGPGSLTLFECEEGTAEVRIVETVVEGRTVYARQ
ncbi:N-acetylglucosamine-6-phosphate deacetylase [Cohnella sp. GCM10027633]|uniref:N-acetylglucosamine-6-phosphate deacetylase n=1 Tax=unclassified Cohnella TaxID=2636738 RepID=UPI003626ACFA